VLGYSINDTVVVFDRIRENLLKKASNDFKEIVNISLNQTLVRSVNTSITTLLVVSALFFLGGETLKPFAMALMFGIIAGTYSSLFLAPPLLARWLRR
jgi:preprotein translocase subunit SecF